MRLHISFVCICLDKGEVDFNNKLLALLVGLLGAEVNQMPTRSATREVVGLFVFAIFKDALIKVFNGFGFFHKSVAGVDSCYLSDFFDAVLVLVAKILDLVIQYL